MNNFFCELHDSTRDESNECVICSDSVSDSDAVDGLVNPSPGGCSTQLATHLTEGIV